MFLIFKSVILQSEWKYLWIYLTHCIILSYKKGTAATAETRDTRERTIDAGKATALSYKELLETVNIVCIFYHVNI